MWKNLKGKIYHAQVLAPVAVTADVNCAGVDVQDLNSLAFLVNVAAFTFTGVNKIAIKLQDSDDNSTFADVTEVYEGTAPVVKTLEAVADGAASHLVEYRGGKRYARLVLDVSGTVSVIVGVVAISNKPELMPPV